MTSWISRRKIIIDRIKATIAVAKKEGLELDDEKFIIEICSEYGCSRRTAQDYLKSARLKKVRYLK